MNFLKETREKKQFFLLDLSWHLYRSHFSFGWMSNNVRGHQKPTGHIFGVLKTLKDIKVKYPRAVIVLCKDGKPIARNEENENYKDGRAKLEYNIHQDLESIIKLSYRVPDTYLAYHEHLEADDVMYSLAKEIEKENEQAKVYIFSGDDDLLQAISDRIFVLRGISKNKEEVIDKEYVCTDEKMLRKFRGCEPENLPIYRSIIGDKSDNLPGLSRFPRELATRVAQDVDRVEEIEDLEYPDLTKAKQNQLTRLQENLELISSNYSMMVLSEDREYEITRLCSREIIKETNELISEWSLTAFRNFLVRINVSNSIGG